MRENGRKVHTAWGGGRRYSKNLGGRGRARRLEGREQLVAYRASAPFSRGSCILAWGQGTEGKN